MLTRALVLMGGMALAGLGGCSLFSTDSPTAYDPGGYYDTGYYYYPNTYGTAVYVPDREAHYYYGRYDDNWRRQHAWHHAREHARWERDRRWRGGYAHER